MTFSETLSLQWLRTAPLFPGSSNKESQSAIHCLKVENHSENVKTAGSQWVNEANTTGCSKNVSKKTQNWAYTTKLI